MHTILACKTWVKYYLTWVNHGVNTPKFGVWLNLLRGRFSGGLILGESKKNGYFHIFGQKTDNILYFQFSFDSFSVSVQGAYCVKKLFDYMQQLSNKSNICCQKRQNFNMSVWHRNGTQFFTCLLDENKQQYFVFSDSYYSFKDSSLKISQLECLQCTYNIIKRAVKQVTMGFCEMVPKSSFIMFVPFVQEGYVDFKMQTTFCEEQYITFKYMVHMVCIYWNCMFDEFNCIATLTCKECNAWPLFEYYFLQWYIILHIFACCVDVR